MKKPAFVVVDCETTGSDWKCDTLHGVGICWEEDKTTYHTSANWDELKAVLGSPDVIKIGHNLRFDVLFLEAAGIPVKGPLYDTMLLAKMLDENQPLGLKPLSQKYLIDSLSAKHELDRTLGKLKLKHVGELCKIDLDPQDPAFGQHSELIGRYCEEDCNNTFRLFVVLRKKLNELDKKVKARFAPETKTPKDVYRDEVSPLERVLIDMEQRGVLINKIWQKELGSKLREKEIKLRGELESSCYFQIAQIEVDLCEKARSKRVTEVARERINPGSLKYKTKFLWSSPKQVSDLVYKKFKVPFGLWQKTEKGQLSVGGQARPQLMLDLGPEHPAFQVLQRYEEWYKCKDLYSKYVEGTSPAALSQVEHLGRVHGQFVQLPKTGRLSHRAPNMGNIPRGPDIKRLFVAPPEKLFFYFDYSQVEFRIMAHLCQDQQMMEACWGDPHSITAQLCGVSRDCAKTLNFALLYGSFPAKLQKIFLAQGGVWKSLEECKDLRETFFAAYPGLLPFLNKTKKAISSQGFSLIETGWIRRFPEVFSGSLAERRSAERKGVNLLGQGLGASITKKAMLALHADGYKLVSQVHDSVLGVLDNSEDLSYHKRRIESLAEKACKLRVPLIAEVKFLNSFSESDVFVASKNQESGHYATTILKQR